MTIASDDNKANYSGDGVIVEFPYTFRVDDEAWMKVYLDDVLQSSGYTVDLGTSKVTFSTAPASGVTVTLLREVDMTQGIDYTSYDAFPAETHELGLDKLTMMAQQLAEASGRTIKAPPSDDGTTDFTLPAYDAGKAIMWDPTTKKMIVSTTNIEEIVTTAAASASSASSSASAAAASASSASSSASAADTSETNAAVSAASAAASYDSFDDRYLGPKASDPTLDNDGDPLITGALYWNTTLNAMRAYDGTTWADMSVVPLYSVSTTGTLAPYKNLTVANNATNPTYQVDVAADELLLTDASGNQVKSTSFSQTVDITVSGAGGLDTGSEANNTWYYIWALRKADGTETAVLSTATAFASVTLPTDYIYGGVVGAANNDGGGNFRNFKQRNNQVACEGWKGLLNQTQTTFTAFDPIIPDTAVLWRGNTEIDDTAGGFTAGSIASTSAGYGETQHQQAGWTGSSVVVSAMSPVPVIEAGTLYYKLAVGTSIDAKTTGWEY